MMHCARRPLAGLLLDLPAALARPTPARAGDPPLPVVGSDVIVTDGSPLQITTQAKAAHTGGREVGLETRHTCLYELHRQRLLASGTRSR